jgi:hypothetical protein
VLAQSAWTSCAIAAIGSASQARAENIALIGHLTRSPTPLARCIDRGEVYLISLVELERRKED